MTKGFDAPRLASQISTAQYFSVMKKLRTAKEVVDHLGGLPRVCELTGANHKQAQHWPGRAKAFPARYYVVMTRALRRRKATAHPSLWNQRGLDDAA